MKKIALGLSAVLAFQAAAPAAFAGGTPISTQEFSVANQAEASRKVIEGLHDLKKDLLDAREDGRGKVALKIRNASLVGLMAGVVVLGVAIKNSSYPAVLIGAAATVTSTIALLGSATYVIAVHEHRNLLAQVESNIKLLTSLESEVQDASTQRAALETLNNALTVLNQELQNPENLRVINGEATVIAGNTSLLVLGLASMTMSGLMMAGASGASKTAIMVTGALLAGGVLGLGGANLVSSIKENQAKELVLVASRLQLRIQARLDKLN